MLQAGLGHSPDSHASEYIIKTSFWCVSILKQYTAIICNPGAVAIRPALLFTRLRGYRYGYAQLFLVPCRLLDSRPSSALSILSSNLESQLFKAQSFRSFLFPANDEWVTFL